MGNLRYTRSDIHALCDRLESRARLAARIDSGQHSVDMIAAARLLRALLESTTPPSSISYWNIDVNGGR